MGLYELLSLRCFSLKYLEEIKRVKVIRRITSKIVQLHMILTYRWSQTAQVPLHLSIGQSYI